MFKFGFDVSESKPEVVKAFESGNYEEASRLARDTQEAAKKAKDPIAEGMALSAYVKSLLALDDTWNARRIGEDLLDLAANSNNMLLRAEAMHSMAKVNIKDSQERRNDPSDVSNRSRTFKEFINRRGEDEAKPSEDTKSAWKELKAAAAFCAEMANEFYKSAGSKEGLASIVITTASIALKGKKVGEAQKLAESAVKKFRDLGSKRGEAAALYGLYEIQLKDDCPEDAVQTLDLIEECFDPNSPEDHSSIGTASVLAATLKYREHEYTDAANRASKAAEFFHTANEGNNKSNALLFLARSLRALGENDDAEQAADAAVQHFKAAHNKTGHAMSLEVAASLLMQKKKVEAAIFTLKEAAFLYRQAKRVYEEGLALNAVSKLQLQIAENGDPKAMEECLRHAQRAIYLFDDCWKIETHENAEANFTAAKVLVMNKDGEEAMKLATESRKVMVALGNRSGEAAALNIMASIQFMSKSTYDSGEEYAREARQIAEDLGDTDLFNSIVEAPGAKKAVANQIQKSHIDIIYAAPGGMVKLAKFFEFQARTASYKSMTSDAPAQGTIAGSGAALAALDSQKVDYAIRWTRVKEKDLDLKKMKDLAL